MAEIELLTQAELLEAVRRFTPRFYTVPLEANPNSGWEIHEGQAKVMERVSQGVVDLVDDLQIRTADGPTRATAHVYFTRPTDAAGAVTFKLGTEVRTPSGLRFFTMADAVFGPSDLGPVSVGAQADQPGYDYNVVAGAISEIGVLAPGSDEDGSMAVTNDSMATGGHPAALDALGWQRGIQREPGEVDASYRARILALPDTVCPGAVDRILQALSVRYGAEFQWSEPWEVGYGWGDDVAWDDDAVWLDRVTENGAFFVLVPDVGNVNDPDNYWDDEFTWGDGYGWSDYDAAKASIATGLMRLLDRIKAGAVAIIVVQVNPPSGAPTWHDNYTDDIEDA